MALFCWGDKTVCGSVEDLHTEPHKTRWALQQQVEFVSCGSTHSLMVANDGKLYSCGQNDFGQLGHSNEESCQFVVPFKSNEPIGLVDGLANYVITRAHCGLSHSVALSEWGNVFSWGSNSFSQLGFSSDNLEPIPKLVTALDTKQVIQLATGDHHNIALTNEGELYAWGLNHSGQCGLGDTKKISTPTKISSLNGIPIAFIACGGSHSFVISKSGAVFGFGKNNYGQLGIGDYVNRLYPTQLKTLRNIGVRHISAGEDFTVFLTQVGGVLTCGAGNYGQTAHGTEDNIFLPRMIFEMMGVKCSQAVCGSRHCLIFVPSHGRIYGFGSGSSGQLGNRSTKDAFLPQIVVGPWTSSSSQTLLNEFNPDNNASFVRRVFSGGEHSFAATSNSCDKPYDCRFFDSKTQIDRLTQSVIEQWSNGNKYDAVQATLISSIETKFGSLECMNGSFLRSEDEPGQTSCSKQNHGVNIKNAETTFHAIQIMENETVHDVIRRSITKKLLPKMFRMSSPPDMEALCVYILLPLYHEFNQA